MILFHVYLFLNINVHPEFTFYAPTAFTPNYGGVNGLFSPKAIGIDPENYHLYIFDRWGLVIWDTDTYDVSTNGEINHGWDGRTKHGYTVQVGVYSWLAVYSDALGNEHSKSGSVTVIR